MNMKRPTHAGIALMVRRLFPWWALLGCAIYAAENESDPWIGTPTGVQVRGERRENGWATRLEYHGRTVARPSGGGEMTMVFENADHSLRDELLAWQADSCRVEDGALVLAGSRRLTHLGRVEIKVHYEAVNDHLIKKTTRVRQRDANMLFYSVATGVAPEGLPASYWSFGQEECGGGSLWEVFPAAGFRPSEGLLVGLLTDNGLRNKWSRCNRRRRTEGDGGLAEILAIRPDPNFLVVAGDDDRKAGHGCVEFTFGQMVNLSKGQPVLECYHPLSQAIDDTKVTFIFVEPGNTLRDLRTSSQVNLAEGLGFRGTTAQKIFYSNQQANVWITDHRDFRPLVVPSLSYSPDMYHRDSFWTVLATHDRRLSESVLQRWAETQADDGCISTIITPYVAFSEYSPNDATMYFIIWNLVNRQRYGSTVDSAAVQRALDFCRRTFDPGGTGKCLMQTTCASDVIWIRQPPGKAHFADNQGMYAVMLRCAKELGCDVREDELQGAVDAYRNFYDPKRGYVQFADNLPGLPEKFRHIRTPSVLVPEFLSWWLFNEPQLPPEQVIGHLQSMPLIHGAMPLHVDAKGEFFTELSHPFDRERNPWPPGVYANGGSYMPFEYLAYVCGLKHGWPPARERMAARVEAELTAHPDEPCSREHMMLNEEWATRPEFKIVFAWNAFMLIADEVAGLRRPEDDPDYRRTESGSE